MATAYNCISLSSHALSYKHENSLLFCESNSILKFGSKIRRINCKLARNGIEGNPSKKAFSPNRMDEYNMAMKRMMRNPYEYHHDLGMNYNMITEDLIVGSQPQKPEDIDHLKNEENVSYILNLQQDKDIDFWGIDLQSVVKRCRQLGILHMRTPWKRQNCRCLSASIFSSISSSSSNSNNSSPYITIDWPNAAPTILDTGAVDFDPDSLRNILPKAVSSLEWAISEGKGKVYVHCTAGLGRAPAVAIAYMFWFCNMNLNDAYEKLTSKRPCGPNKRAIRAATYDLAKNDPWKEPFENLPEHAFEGVADWERRLIQDRVRALHET